MKIGIFFPSSVAENSGNRVTASRWARLLEELGHEVLLSNDYIDEQLDIAVRLHVFKTAEIEKRIRSRSPNTKIAVALTGTDIRGATELKIKAFETLESADAIICLNSNTHSNLPKEIKDRAFFVPQSAAVASKPAPSNSDEFCVLVAGHLRHEKDPLRTALASQLLPKSSRIVVKHFGRALDDSLGQQAFEETKSNPRYEWFAEVSHERLLEELAAADLVVHSSRIDEGPSLVSEAIAAGRPLLISNIPGLVSVLGDEYPGIFEVEDTKKLASLLVKAEEDRPWLRSLRTHILKLQESLSQEAEKSAWQNVLKIIS